MIRLLRRAIPAAAILALWSGCIEPVGNGIDMNPYGVPPGPGYFVNAIYPIFQKPQYGCTTCHSQYGPGYQGTGGAQGGLDLTESPDSVYALLVNHLAYEPSNDITPPYSMYRVDPGNPNSSYLYLKLSESHPPYGGQMPLTGPPFLSVQDLNTILIWIQAGAPK